MAEIEGDTSKLDNLLSTINWRDRHRSYYGNGEITRNNNSGAPFSGGVQYDNNLGKKYGGRFAGLVAPILSSAVQSGRPDALAFNSAPAARPSNRWRLGRPFIRRMSRMDNKDDEPQSMPAYIPAYSPGYAYGSAPVGYQARYDNDAFQSAPADLYPQTGYYPFNAGTNPQELNALPPSRVASIADSIAPDDSASVTNPTDRPEFSYGIAHDGIDVTLGQGPDQHASDLYSASSQASMGTGVAPPTILNPQIPEAPLESYQPLGIPSKQAASNVVEPVATPMYPETPVDPEKLGVHVVADEIDPSTSDMQYDPIDLDSYASPISPQLLAPGQQPPDRRPDVSSLVEQTSPDDISGGLDYKDFLMRHTWDSSQRTDFGFSPPTTYTIIEVSGHESLVQRSTIVRDELMTWIGDKTFLETSGGEKRPPRTRLLLHTCHPSMIQDIRLLPFVDMDQVTNVLKTLHLPIDYFSTMIGASQCPPLFTHGPGERLNLRIQTATPSTGFISMAISHDRKTNITTGFIWLEEGFVKLEDQLCSLTRYASHPLLYAILVLVLQNELFTRRNIELSSEIERFNEKLEPGLRKIAEDDIISILALTNISTPKFALETCRRIDAAIVTEVFDDLQRKMDGEVRDFFRVVESTVLDNFQWHDQLKTQFEQERQAIYWMLQRQDTQIALKDSSRMKSIAILTMVFLPATAIATIFSMNPFFASLSDATGTVRLAVSRDFWIFWSVVLPITLATVLVYASWTQRRELWKFLRHPTWYLITRPEIRRQLKSGRYTASEERQLQTELRLLEEDLGKPARARRALRRLAREDDANSLFGAAANSKGGFPGGVSGQPPMPPGQQQQQGDAWGTWGYEKQGVAMYQAPYQSPYSAPPLMEPVQYTMPYSAPPLMEPVQYPTPYPPARNVVDL